MKSYKDLEIIDLIERARLRDDSAFADIISRYMPMLNKLVSGFVSPILTYDEAYAEACVALHNAALKYDIDKSDEITFGLYAHICVRHALLTLASRTKDKGNRVDVDVDMLGSGMNIEERIVDRERMDEYLNTARKLLSEYEYSVFLLYLDGDKNPEIARKLGKDAKSIENAKSRMFKNLRRESNLFFDI